MFKFSLLTKFVNSVDANYGPLSKTTTSGIPCLAKRDANTHVPLLEVVIERVSTSR